MPVPTKSASITEKVAMSKALAKLKAAKNPEVPDEIPESIAEAIVDLLKALESQKVPVDGGSFSLARALPAVGHKLANSIIYKEDISAFFADFAARNKSFLKRFNDKDPVNRRALVQEILGVDFPNPIVRLPSTCPPVKVFDRYWWDVLDDYHIFGKRNKNIF